MEINIRKQKRRQQTINEQLQIKQIQFNIERAHRVHRNVSQYYGYDIYAGMEHAMCEKQHHFAWILLIFFFLLFPLSMSLIVHLLSKQRQMICFGVAHLPFMEVKSSYWAKH